jgi:hypothetical protein
VAHDEREWHMLRTGNDRCVRVRNQRPLALRGSINGQPEVNGSTNVSKLRGFECDEEVADGLAKMTIAKFKRSIAESPFKFMKLELIPIRKLRHLAKLPLMQELLTSTVRAELSIR